MLVALSSSSSVIKGSKLVLFHSETQSRTGGVLGAVPSAAVMGSRRIFPGGGGKFVTIHTQVFTVTTNAQNTLQHFQSIALKTFLFF